MGVKEKQMSFLNEVENDEGPDSMHESEGDLTPVGLAGLFEALPQPVSVQLSQDPHRWRRVAFELELELEEELS